MKCYAIRPIEEGEKEQYDDLLKLGLAHFGWSYRDGCDLKILENMNDDMFERDWGKDSSCWNQAKWLLNIKPDDWVAYINIPSYGNVTIAKVTSKYYYQNEYLIEGDGRHSFDIDKKTIKTIQRKDYPKLNFSNRGKYWTLDTQIFRNYFSLDNSIQVREDETVQEYISLLKNHKNIVLTGAPGTGKTYLAKKIAGAFTKRADISGEQKVVNNITDDVIRKYIVEGLEIPSSKGRTKYKIRKMNDNSKLIIGGDSIQDYEIPIAGIVAAFSIKLWEGGKQENGFDPYNAAIAKYIFEKLNQATKYTASTEEEESEYITFAQFHPSYDYSDFVEGLRPVQNEDGTIGFELKDGVFKSLCKKALSGTKNGGQDNFEESWKKLVETLENTTFVDIKLKTVDSTFTVEINEYGTGLASRTYPSEEAKKIGDWTSGKSKFFNKDQLYNIYRGLPGVPAGGHDNYRKLIVAHMKEHFGLLDYKEGEKASNEQKFVMIIDEINRAELSKVFGELFYSIDPGYRGEKGKVQLQYSNLYKDESDPFKDGFYVPENVYIIATMNDIDRSIEPFDFAMKRRFAWKEVTAKESQNMLDEYVNESWYDESIKKMNAINRTIQESFPIYSKINTYGEEEISSPYDIGASYFRKLNKDLLNGNFDDLWKYHIEAVLRDYLKGFSDAKSKLEKFKKVYDNPMSVTKQTNEIVENDNTQG